MSTVEVLWVKATATKQEQEQTSTANLQRVQKTFEQFDTLAKQIAPLSQEQLAPMVEVANTILTVINKREQHKLSGKAGAFLNALIAGDAEQALKALISKQEPIVSSESQSGVIEKLRKALSGQAVPKSPQTRDPFNDKGAAVVANNPPCHVLFQAIAKGGPNARNLKNGWEDNPINPELPVFKNPQRTKGDWTVYFDPNSGPLAEQWNRVEGLSALHTKLALFCFAKICDPRNAMRHPSKDPVGVSYEDFRQALGFTQRGKALTEFKTQTDQLVRDIADLKATVRGIMINGKPDGIAECSLFTISKVWDKQYEFFENRVQIGWLIDSGPWAKNYFNRDAKPWLSTLHAAILELDHRGVRRADVLALHIATMLFTVAGGDQFKEQTITRTVEDLLELAGELPEPEHRGGHWGNRLCEALHCALETLQGLRLATVVFSKNYPDPGDRGKGWVERWLSAKVHLTTPEAAAFLGRDIPDPVAQLPTRLERKQRARKPVKVQVPGEKLDTAKADRLRALIAQKFPNQTKAAQHFGCSQAALSRALNRITAPAPTLAAKLKAFVDSPQE